MNEPKSPIAKPVQARRHPSERISEVLTKGWLPYNRIGASREQYPVGIPMSVDGNAPGGDNNEPSSSSAAKETRVLSELAASVHTLESISQLLDHIAALTCAPDKGDDSVGSAGTKRPAGLESIATKQLALLDELGQWDKVLGRGGGDGGGADKDHKVAEQANAGGEKDT